MTKRELETLLANLHKQLDFRKTLGGYSAEAEIITFLTSALWLSVGHLLKLEEDITALKRQLPKKKQ